MPRPRYVITESDQDIAYRWIFNKIAASGGYGIFPRDEDMELNKRAHRAFNKFTKDYYRLDELNRWCEKWMTSEQWNQMKGTIRAKRKRRTKKAATVSLDSQVHYMLATVAQYEGLTLSDTIKKYLSKKYDKIPTDFQPVLWIDKYPD